MSGPERRSPDDLALFVTRLLESIDPRAVLESLEQVSRRDYVLRVNRGGEIGKPLRLSMRRVQRAVSEARAEQMLRSVLRSQLLALRSADTIYQSRRLLHGDPAEDLCPVCRRLVPIEEPPFFQSGRLVHVRCVMGGPRPADPR